MPWTALDRPSQLWARQKPRLPCCGLFQRHGSAKSAPKVLAHPAFTQLPPLPPLPPANSETHPHVVSSRLATPARFGTHASATSRLLRSALPSSSGLPGSWGTYCQRWSQVRTRDKSPNDLDAHHACDNESVTCEIMAALYCWRVGPLHNSPTMTIPSHSPPFSFVRTLGGMCSAIVTSPFGVVKTRLQSDLLRQKHAGVGAVVGDSVVLIRRAGGFLWHFVKTAHIIWLHPPFFPLFAPSRHSRTQHVIFWGMFFLTT
jgi:hypothetical protein